MPTYGHLRAGLAALAGRMRPAGRQLDNAVVEGEHREFKFGLPVDHSMFQPTDDKTVPFWIFMPLKNISETAKARVFKFCAMVGHVKCYEMT